MTDTRKDKRAPLSLKVRFKSATVDEFIEQYATDISRGGIYIKSKQPMAIGTLLKFEFQLKDESKLIQGVGRVVWKREAGEGATDANPSGMGIKFIKMDPESKALVEQIVAGRGEAPGQYEAGGGLSAGADEEAGAATSPAAGDSASSKRPIRSAKATMQFFPSTTPQNEMPPPEDRTQVRHASEFLASALGAAGTDEATAGEADKSADEARKRTEEIEREREEQQRKSREDEAFKARAEKDRQEREKAEAARAEEEKAEEAAAAVAAAAAEKAADKKPSKAESSKAESSKAESSKAESSKAESSKAESSKTAAKAKPASDEKAAAKPAAKAGEKKSDARPVAVAPAPEAPQSNMLPIFAVVAAAVLIGGYFMFGRGTTEAPQTDLPPPPPVVADETPTPTVDDTPPVEDAPEVIPEVVVDEPPAPTFDVAVATTPVGATIFVDGEPSGTSPATLSITEGPHAVEARLEGYRTGTAEATGAAAARPLRITLTALPYAVTVTTTPPGARVRIGGRTVIAPGRTEIPRPTSPLTATAVLAGYLEGVSTLTPTEFVAGEDAMTAEISIVLTPRPAPPVVTPRTPRPPRPPVEGTEDGETPPVVEHTATPPAEHTATPPAEHTATPPAEHTVTPPVEHTAPPPVEHTPPPPAEHEAPPDNPF